MAKTVAQRLTEALTEQLDREYCGAFKRKFGIRVKRHETIMGTVEPIPDKGSVSRDQLRYAQGFEDGYEAAMNVVSAYGVSR